MGIWEWILTIVLFIISLSLLITIHELGHFSMAKLFNVYCNEFSIGFGPALLHKRKEGKETYFSIRAIPLGGYVAMAGEETNFENVVVEKERSIEGIKRWKKAIVVSAGIILNAVLALILFGISDICFPLTQLTTKAHVLETSELYSQGLRDNDKLYLIGPADDKAVIFDNEKIGDEHYSGSFYIINDDVTINENKYVACFVPSGNKTEPVLSSSIYFYPIDQEGKMKDTIVFARWAQSGVTLINYPDITKGLYNLIETVNVDIPVKFYKYNESTETYNNTPVTYVFHMSSTREKEGSDKFVWNDLGVTLKTVDTWLPFGERVKNTFIDFGEGAIAVFKGLGMLFTQGPQNMSGVIGILSVSSTVIKNYTFSTYISMWGLISVNLAIFNLLPFPGLDGWQLLVTAVEGATNSVKRRKYIKANGNDSGYEGWKIPTKVKGIVSYVGLGLLFALMIVIGVFDIIKLF